MTHVAIFFVPAGATPRDLEAALGEHLKSLEIREIAPVEIPGQAEITDDEPLPAWTWFIPNPRR